MTTPFNLSDPDISSVFKQYIAALDPPSVHHKGSQVIRPVVLITHEGRVDGFDFFSAGLKIAITNPGTWARGVLIEADHTLGDLFNITNETNDPYRRDAVVVKPNNRTGLNVRHDQTVQAIMDVRLSDLITPGIQVVAYSDFGDDMLQLLDSTGVARVIVNSIGELYGGKNVFFYGDGVQVGSNLPDFGGGVKVIGIDNAATRPTTNPTDGVVLYASSNYMRFRDVNGETWPWPDGDPHPSLHGLFGWTFDPSLSSGAAHLNEGTVYLQKFFVPLRNTLSSMMFNVINAANAPSAAYVGLYSVSGTLLAVSANTSSSFTSVGMKTVPFTVPYDAQPGYYYTAQLVVAGPGLGPDLSNAGGSVGMNNVNLSGATLRSATGPTGQATLPSSITMSSNVLTSNFVWTGVK